jgi:putative peptide zinc metalloprotease protein
MALATNLPASGRRFGGGPTAIDMLPALRDDLDLVPGPRQLDGSPSWTVHDPARNAFYRVGWREFCILSEWRAVPPATLARLVASRRGIAVEVSEVQAMAEFLLANQLVVCDDETGIARLLRDRAQRKRNPALWLLHSYLFFRVPLLRPDKALARVAPFCRVFFTRGYWLLLGALGLFGLFLVSRQWDKFAQSLADSLTLQGLVWFVVALALSKVVHELGHGITAKHHGLRVPTMGLAFLLFWPVPYTDTTDAWRLVSRRARIAIGAAGVAAEISLAVIATLVWCAAPDGPVRNAAFAMAVVNWLSTIAVNLSPFMRFDGYYILADWLEVPNLQNRSFALARWRLREFLFAFGAPPPEQFSSRRRKLLLAYAYATWLYRFVLFLGIALAVYHYFFKLLGLFLLAVEIWWFILRPVGQEMRVWLKQRREMRVTRGGVAALLALAGFVALLALPWRGEVAAPAFLGAEQVAKIYAPLPGRLARVHVRDGESVAAEAPIFDLDSPTIEHGIKSTRLEIELLRREIEQSAADAAQAEKQPLLIEKLLASRAKLAGLVEERARLAIRAPFAGRVTQLATEAHHGQWLNEKILLAVLIDPRRAVVTAYIDEHDFARLRAGARARFLPEIPEAAERTLEVVSIEPTNLSALAIPALASIHGGEIAVTREPDGTLRPANAVYRVHFAPIAADPPLASDLRGTVLIVATPQSPLARLWRHAAAVLVREVSF